MAFAYPGGCLALDGLNLIIEPGQIVAVVGPSGSGKSTLWRLIPRLYDVQEGEILVNGVDVRQWPLEQLRELFACMPQGDEAFLFDKTIEENICFSRPDATVEEIEEAARLAAVHEDILHLPKGYQSRVGERGTNLSGGQRQRVALARTLLARRRAMILDEYTNELDSVTESRIHQNLRRYLERRTAVIIAHRLSTVAEVADKIVVLQNGRKVEEGSHDELVGLNGLYAEMAELQVVVR